MPRKSRKKSIISYVGSKNKGNLVGAWAFLIGVILAVIIGLIGTEVSTVILGLLVILGLIVGILNVGDKDVNTFLIAAAVLVIVSWMGSDALGVISVLGKILNALLVMFIPATVIVALKAVFAIAKS